MDMVVCQYCNSEVTLAEVEKEGGLCPECGAMMDSSQLFAETDDDFDADATDDFDEDDFDDDDDDGDDEDDEF